MSRLNTRFLLGECRTGRVTINGQQDLEGTRRLEDLATQRISVETEDSEDYALRWTREKQL